MEKTAASIPQDVNAKLVFRHSIRPTLKGCDNPDEVPLTPEGVCLARFFGKGIDMEVGFVGASRVRRCSETVEAILDARHQKDKVVVISPTLSSFFVNDPYIFKNAKEEKMGLKDLILSINRGEIIPGMHSLEDSVRVLLDFIFDVGNKVNTIDLFCTHDFQVMLVVSLLFNRFMSKNEIVENWPRMLEGVFFWGRRNDFFCSWRGEIKHFANF